MPTKRFVQIRLENNEGAFSDGSFIPSNLHAEKDDTIVWFVTRRAGSISVFDPTHRSIEERADLVTDARITLVFQNHTPVESPRVYGSDGFASARVRNESAPGVYHYSALITSAKGEVVLDVRCPEIIIQR